MDKVNDYNEITPSVDEALRLIEQTDEMSELEVKRMLSDAGCMSHCRDLWLLRSAVRRKHVAVPDSDVEWRKFISGKTQGDTGAAMDPAVKGSHTVRRAFIWGSLAGIAASAVVAVVLSLLLPGKHTEYVAYTASGEPVQVTIESNSNGEIVLSDDAGSQLSGLSGNIVRTDSSITYKNVGPVDGAVQNHVLTTSRGATFKAVLADGTTVWLNAGSSLSYPSRFEGGERRVRLNGEAYFKVARNVRQPFIVDCGNMTTRVLGTEFNILTRGNLTPHVTLVQGSVEVCSKHSNKVVRLHPGEDAAVYDNGNITTRNVDTDVLVYWKEGYFFFDNVTVVDIMRNLGEWYNKTVIFRDTTSMQHRMHYFCERNAGIRTALEQFNHIGKVKAVLDGDIIYIDE